MLKTIYAAFAMLLRENIGMGGLEQAEMKESEREGCRCDSQVIKPECSLHTTLESEAVGGSDKDNSHQTPYYCNRIFPFEVFDRGLSAKLFAKGTPHQFIAISGSPAPEELHDRFTKVLKSDPDAYKPIPVIHTLGLSTSLSWSLATTSMDEWVSLADASGRNAPFLWVGPNAAGHLKPPGQILSQGNNALWHYTVEMAKEARARELDALGMYNLTLQASSWDGSGYGLRVGLVQAMMVNFMTLMPLIR